MAGFALHIWLLPGFLFVRHVRVAGLARLVAGKLRRVLCNLADGRSAIVPILAEAFGDHVVAHHQKDQKGEDKEPREPEKMPCILEDTHPTLSKTPLPGASAHQSRCDLKHSSQV